MMEENNSFNVKNNFTHFSSGREIYIHVFYLSFAMFCTLKLSIFCCCFFINTKTFFPTAKKAAKQCQSQLHIRSFVCEQQ